MKCLQRIYFLMFFCVNKPTSLDTLGSQTEKRNQEISWLPSTVQNFPVSHRKKKQLKEQSLTPSGFLLLFTILAKTNGCGLLLQTPIFL